jgi:hypothetical protein
MTRLRGTTSISYREERDWGMEAALSVTMATCLMVAALSLSPNEEEVGGFA